MHARSWALQSVPWLAGCMLVMTQITSVAWMWSVDSPWLMWLGVAAIQGYGLSVAWRLAKPNKSLYFNGNKLLICDKQGHVIKQVSTPNGFASPFFIGLSTGRLTNFGLFSGQLRPSEFAALLRWMHWR